MHPTILSLLLFSAPLTGVAQDTPHEPFVFRSVVDERARMVSVALDEDMWLAYDATYCGLYRAWKGGVVLQGAVYDAVHGPQPTTWGKSYLEGLADKPVWSLVHGDERKQVTPRFLGYDTRGRSVTLRYELPWGEGTALVTEHPVYRQQGQAWPTLERHFEVKAKAGGAALDGAYFLELLLDPQGSVLCLPAGKTVGSTSFDPAMVANIERPAGLGEMLVDEGAMSGEELNQEAILEVAMTLTPPSIDGNLDAVWDQVSAQAMTKHLRDEPSAEGDLNAEFKLLYDAQYLYVLFLVHDDEYQADNLTQPYHDDAVEVYLDAKNDKADHFGSDDAQYIFAVHAKEVWAGNGAAMHPGIDFKPGPIENGYAMEIRLPWENLGVQIVPGMEIGLELHVDDDDDGRDADHVLSWNSYSTNSWSDTGNFATVSLAPPTAEGLSDVGPVEPGVSLRAWSIEQSMGELMRLVPGQTPNVSRLVERIDLSGAQAFGGLEDRFIAEIRGFIRVDEAGMHNFRLSSDDGSRLWIDNRPVIDHDGLHGPDPKLGNLELGVGLHALRMMMFDDEGGELLRLEWQRPGQSGFEILGADALSTTRGQVRVTSPGRKRVIRAGAKLDPGNGAPLAGVHPAYDLTTIRPEGFEPKVGGMDFLPDGRLVICTWDPTGAVYIIDGVQSKDGSGISVHQFATGLAEPLGLEVVNGEIYVLQKQELTHLVDNDGDGVCDEYRALANGWTVSPNFHEFAFGLIFHENHFYATLAAAIIAGGSSPSPQLPDRGKVMKIAMDGSYSMVASGLRTPNGIGFGTDGQIFIADNQGDWLPSSKILHLREGAFYGFRSVDPEGTKDLKVSPPAVWLPQGEIGNSPGEVVPIHDGPYAGQQLHTEITHGGLKRVFLEPVNGEYQGAVFRFSQGLEAGINRAVWGPDGGLYVGGIGSTGNWGHEGKQRFGLQRLNYNGASVFEMLAVRAKANGFEIELTEPLPPGNGWNAIDYSLTQWRYFSTVDYGGPKLDETILQVLSASVSADRKRVFLEVPGLKEGHVIHLHISGPIQSESGQLPWATEAWYTLNKLPQMAGVVLDSPAKAKPNALSPEELAAGFGLLFDGHDASQWLGFRMDHLPDSWSAVDGTLRMTPGGERGDIATRKEYESFDLRLEWRLAPGGNSGVFFHATEDHGSAWETAPEMQILDNALHADGKAGTTSAGSNYALMAPSFDACRPAGQWNEARLVVRGDRVRHYLNGFEIVAYTLGSPEWQERVANSKFASLPDYGKTGKGHIVLQDHGDLVEFRSIRIRELKD
jgi:hypothetical protein